MPASFLQELAYQYLTDKESLDRTQVWKALRDHSDVELATECKMSLGLERSPFSESDLAGAFSQLRIANAGDLGVYALKLLGGGNMPLRARDLSPRKRNQLALLEVYAARSQAQGHSGASSALKELLGILPDSTSPGRLTLSDIAEKYGLEEADLKQALKEEEGEIARRRDDIINAHSGPRSPVASLH